MSDGTSSQSPLILDALGSFFVGGTSVAREAAEAGLYGGGSLTVDQMYVQFMIPRSPSRPPIVMIHGSTLSGKTFETTPDGRMGWYEYFTRNGFPTYVVDQVGRARSGFDNGPFNRPDAAVGLQPVLRRVATEVAWVRFRFGPSAGVAFDDTVFPIEAVQEFAKQSVPDLSQSFPPDDPNYAALSELAINLKDVVLMGHSQGGRYPFETALRNPKGIRALIAIEPPGCRSGEYTDQDVAKLAKVPILFVFGDHLETPQFYGPNWLTFYEDCEAFIARIRKAGGKAKMIRLSDLGISGNSHLPMQDKNNLQVAALIIDWIDSI